MRNNQRGGIAFNMTLIILVLAIGALAYIMFRGSTKSTDTTDIPIQYVPDTRPAPTPTDGEFSDGLGRANAITRYPLDELGEGISSISIFNRDINNDGVMDRITRTHYETGTGHSYDEYKIELSQNGKLVNITPAEFRTVEGADCALQKIRFSFSPTFTVTKISRPLADSWDTPSTATKTEYRLSGNTLHSLPSIQMREICNVAELF